MDFDRTFRQFVNQCGEWLRGSGPESDIVISSRIRLARTWLISHSCAGVPTTIVHPLTGPYVKSFSRATASRACFL